MNGIEVHQGLRAGFRPAENPFFNPGTRIDKMGPLPVKIGMEVYGDPRQQHHAEDGSHTHIPVLIGITHTLFLSGYLKVRHLSI